MIFNPVEIYFSNRSKQTNVPPLLSNGNVINSVDSHKQLGLILDKNLSVENHINEKISKANKVIGMIKRLCSLLPRNSLLTIYKSFVRPHLDYCNIIYHKSGNDGISYTNYSPGNVINPIKLFNDKIESMQYNAALATGCIRGTSREKLCQELGLMSLCNSRTFHRFVYFYKIKNIMASNYLNHFIPACRPNTYGHRHHRTDYIAARTHKYKFSFFPHFVSAWSNLSKLISGSPSLSIFKSRYLKYFNQKQDSIYGVHNPIGLKYLTRLRTGLSHLNTHKYSHKFHDTPNPSCVCDGISHESIERYLLRCPNFENCREKLFRSLLSRIYIIPFTNSYLSHLLLYGCDTFNTSTNKFILTSVIEYLIATSRFEGTLYQ